jgi:hypothetical protein
LVINALCGCLFPLAPTTVPISQVSLDQVDAGAQWHDLFTATGAPSQLSASAIAVVPAGGQAIPLPAAAAPGLATLVIASFTIVHRSRAARRTD